MFWGWPGNARSQRLRAALLESPGTAVATCSLLFPGCLRQNPCSEVLLNFFVGIFFIFFPLIFAPGAAASFLLAPSVNPLPGVEKPRGADAAPLGPLCPAFPGLFGLFGTRGVVFYLGFFLGEQLSCSGSGLLSFWDGSWETRRDPRSRA